MQRYMPQVRGVKEARYFTVDLLISGVELPGLLWLPLIIPSTSFNSTCLDSKLKGMIDNRDNWAMELKDENSVIVEHRSHRTMSLARSLAGTSFLGASNTD
jgi:hypothetical protein